MTIEFPDAIKPYVPVGMSARLVVGTFSMAQQTTRALPNRQIPNYWIQFRNALNSSGVIDHVDMGTINPALITPGTNQIVLVVIDVPQSENVAEEFLKFKTNKQDGGAMVAGCWCPDGGAGRFAVEQDNYYLTGWLLTPKNVVQMGGRIWLGIGALALVTCILSIFLQCLMFAIIPILIFGYTKWLQSQKDKGKLLDARWGQQVTQAWMMELVETGKFKQQYQSAFPGDSLSNGERL